MTSMGDRGARRAGAGAASTLNAGAVADGHDASRAAPRAVSGDAKPANLNFTLKDVNNNDVKLVGVQGQGRSCSTSGRRGAARARSRSRGSSSSRRSTARAACRSSASRSTTRATSSSLTSREMKMNYPVLQGLDHDDVQDAYGPMFGIPVTRRDFPRRQDLREAHRPVVEGRVRERDQVAAVTRLAPRAA